MAKKLSPDRIHSELKKLDDKANVSAFIVLKGAKHIGAIRFSYPRDGAGRLKCVAADWTTQAPDGQDSATWTRWQYGWASGYGYDKRTAAMAGMTIGDCTIKDDGWDWERQLRDCGYVVIRAV